MFTGGDTRFKNSSHIFSHRHSKIGSTTAASLFDELFCSDEFSVSLSISFQLKLSVLTENHALPESQLKRVVCSPTLTRVTLMSAQISRLGPAYKVTISPSKNLQFSM